MSNPQGLNVNGCAKAKKNDGAVYRHERELERHVPIHEVRSGRKGLYLFCSIKLQERLDEPLAPTFQPSDLRGVVKSWDKLQNCVLVNGF